MRALAIHAGPRALVHLREHGLRPSDVRAIPAAAGGPKGLVLSPLDRFIFGEWLAPAAHTGHLLSTFNGAWRAAPGLLASPPAGLGLEAGADIPPENVPAPREPRKPT